MGRRQGDSGYRRDVFAVSKAIGWMPHCLRPWAALRPVLRVPVWVSSILDFPLDKK